MASRGSAIELVPNKLYYVALRSGPTESSKQAAHYWSADEFSYWNFFLDWGPLSLGNLFRFCRTLNYKLKSDRLLGKAIYVYSGSHAHKRTNAAFLLCAWLLLYGGRTPEQAFAPFQDVFPPFPPFHDASPCVCTFDLTIPHCLRGLQKAFRFGFFDFNTFDVEEYEHYEQVENGDLNWLVDGKFLAFAGPHNRSEMTREGYRTLTPRNYIPYFKKHNVTLVIRLNKKYYDEQLFLDAGIDHLEAYFPDGSVPPPNIVRQFISACEATPGAVAVHCKAGLGRTGTCIGCYIMKHYSLSAAEVIGWMRVCRPGSVIGPQQHYLERMEGPMHREGFAFRQRVGQFSSPRRLPEDHSPRWGVTGQQRVKHPAGGGTPGAGAGGAAVMGNVRGSIGREARRGSEPSSQSTSSAAATGGRSSRTPRPFAASLTAGRGGTDCGIAGKEGPPPHRSHVSPDHQRYRNADSNSSNTSTRRKSTGMDTSQQQAPPSSLERGDGAERMSRSLTGSKRGDGGRGKGGGGGGAYGRTASMQRDRDAIGNTGFRRASVPPGRAAGRFAQVSPAQKRLANAAASLNAAAEAKAARDRTSVDAWEEMAAAGEVDAGRGGWTLGGRTQGDFLLQQRARGCGKQESRR